MENPNNQLSLTSIDLDLLRAESAKQQKLTKTATQFLKSTTSGRYLENLSPDELAKIGRKLENPAQLLAGPNILKWQNIRRQKGEFLL